MGEKVLDLTSSPMDWIRATWQNGEDLYEYTD
jgi:hypothetical protein